MSRRTIVAAAAAVVVVGLVAGLTTLLAGAGPGATVDSVEDPTPAPDVDATTAPPTAGPATIQALISSTLPSPDAIPTPEPTEPPEPSYPVAEVQQKLKDLRYYRGPVDGEEGAATTSAVMAFQKIQGLSVDGVVGPATLAALDDPKRPEPRNGPDRRIEIDLTRQVVFWITGGEIAQIFPASSGSGEAYTTASGGTARSLTPVGWYVIERRISGIRDAPLGILYDPLYFYKGWAIHGSNSVPAYPASHGCVRLPRADARWLFDRAPNGTPIHSYGGEHTFEAGSDAPGTDTPAGDTGEDEQQPQQEPSRPPNRAPVANDDTADVLVGGRTTIDVLDNDSDDQSLDGATLEIASTPRRGSAEVVAGAVRYHAPDRAGTFEFAYRVCDSRGGCDRARVTVTVNQPEPTQPEEPTSTPSTNAITDREIAT